jgi:hypothetical protein
MGSQARPLEPVVTLEYAHGIYRVRIVMLAREFEQVQPLVAVSREDRIARHPIGEFQMIELRVRAD